MNVKPHSVGINAILLFLLSLLQSFAHPLLGQPSASPAQQRDIFSHYQSQAEQHLATMSLDERISQILLVRYPDLNGVEDLQAHQFGGYAFFAKDFANKTKAEVQNMIQSLQSVAKVPILTAVDEEGGQVVRVSSNPLLSPQPFASPQDVYNIGGMSAIREDTISKSRLLAELGINLNLAPVVDVSTNPQDYMYQRSLGQNPELTAQFARNVILASKHTGVSYTLKHFPGYGNNVDTHTGESVDTRTYEQIQQNDLLPFRAGINIGAEAVLVSHNIVNSIDAHFPASLSTAVHQLLREDLKFSGVIITDDLAMGAVSQLSNPTAQAVIAGNDLIITSDYQQSISEIKAALANDTLDESKINQAATHVLAWKYYKGMIK